MGMSGVVGGHGSGAPAIGGAAGLVPGVSKASPIAEGVAQIERRSSEIFRRRLGRLIRLFAIWGDPSIFGWTVPAVSRSSE